MTEPVLTAAFWDYDRTMPLADGRVSVAGVRLDCRILKPEAAFARAFGGAEFDVSELSFSNSVTAVSKGPFAYRLIPVFLSRAFRHAAVFVRTDRGIRTPEDLAGRTVGVQEYDMTAAVVVRGLLRDRYGVQASAIRWKVGDLERPKPLAFPLGRPPDGVDIEILPPGRSLDDRFRAGELDAIITLRPPDGWRDGGEPWVAPLFADSAAAERNYYRDTGVFPIMHAVGVRATRLDAQPDLGRRLFDAFTAAKRLAVAELEVTQASKVTLPWAADALRRARAVLGDDIWPYGMAANRHALETGLRWSREDGLQARAIALEELFDPRCLDT